MDCSADSDFMPGVDKAFFQRCEKDGIEIEIGRLPNPPHSFAPERRRESEAAREIARRMLRQHGVHDAELARHAEGFPIWPDGWTGSLSHSAGWCAVALARGDTVGGVGVDLEDPLRMKPEMWAHIMTEVERRRLDSLSQIAAAQRATAIFGAKEALFKALYPTRRQAPGFLEVEINWSGGGNFHATVHIDQSHQSEATVVAQGRCAGFSGMVLAVCWIPPHDVAQRGERGK